MRTRRPIEIALIVPSTIARSSVRGSISRMRAASALVMVAREEAASSARLVIVSLMPDVCAGSFLAPRFGA